MDINELRQIDESIALTDGSCRCDDGGCPRCHVLDLLWNVRTHLSAGQENGTVVNPPLH